jgi:hypothetical protein
VIRLIRDGKVDPADLPGDDPLACCTTHVRPTLELHIGHHDLLPLPLRIAHVKELGAEYRAAAIGDLNSIVLIVPVPA